MSARPTIGWCAGRRVSAAFAAHAGHFSDALPAAGTRADEGSDWAPQAGASPSLEVIIRLCSSAFIPNGRIFLGVFIFRYFFIGRESEYLMYFGLTTLKQARKNLRNFSSFCKARKFKV